MFKRLVKIFMWITIAFFVIISIALVIIRIKFPPQKIKQMIISELELATNRSVEIGKFWFNPIKGFSLDDVVIYQHPPHDTVSSDTAIFFRSDKLYLKYRLSSLLKRKVEIVDILIDQPVINLIQDRDRRWNFEDLIMPDTAKVVAQPIPPDTGFVGFKLPVSFQLKKFSLNRLKLNLSIDMIDTLYAVRTGGLSVNINDLFIPRQFPDEFKTNARADLQLLADQQPWEVKVKTSDSEQVTELSSNLQLNLKLKISGLNNVRSEGEISLSNLALKNKPDKISTPRQLTFSIPKFVSIFYGLATNAETGILDLDHLTAQIGEETIFDIRGKVTDFSNQPFFDLEVVRSQINLQNLISVIKPLLPDSIQQQSEDFAIRGIASFNGTTIKGNPLSENIEDAQVIRLLFSVDDFHASYVDPIIKLDNLKIRSQVTEIHNLNGVQKANINVDASLDSFAIMVDTLKMKYSGLHLNFKTALNSKFFPDSVTTQLMVDNFYDVPLNFSFYFKSLAGINQFKSDGNLVVNQLPLEQLTESTLTGLIDLTLNFTAESLDKIDVNLNVASDIIEVETETEPLILYPMDIKSVAMLSTDTLFQQLELNQLTVGINNFASALAHGDILFDTPQRINLIIDNLHIDHEKLMDVLPAQLVEGMENLKVTGATALTSNISMVIPEHEDPVLDVNGRVATLASIKYPDQFLTLNRISGQVDFQTNGESARFNLEAMLDSLIIEGIFDDPLRNMSLQMEANLLDLETVKIDSAIIILPDLMTRAIISGQVDSLSGNLLAEANADLTLNSQGKNLSLLNMIQFNGKLSQYLDIGFSDNIIDVNGRLQIDHLDVKYEDLAQVDSIEGTIFFAQKFDIENKILIENPIAGSFMADVGSYYYDLLRPFYQQSKDQFSNLRIAKVAAMDYYATNINFDFFIQNERIEIPRFSLNAYDGNLAGLIFVNLHQGKPDQYEWKVKANVSRLNSAKLLPTRKLKARGSDVNMNLELVGSGIDPESQLDIEGYLYVTQIGPQFTDNVLRSLDPKGTDKSIQDTRKLLNWGYKPRLISFEIKHGNLYPTIHLVKGNFLTKLIPLNLSGGRIELARIPIKFLLKDIMAESR